MKLLLALTLLLANAQPSSNGNGVDSGSCGVSVVSLNLAKEGDLGRILRTFPSGVESEYPDVFLLQEVPNGRAAPSVAEEMAHQLGYFVSFAPARPEVYDQGLAIVSRYPMSDVGLIPLKACDLRFRSRTRFAMAARLETPCGDLRVWNLHLDTRINAGERLEQLAPVLEQTSQHQGPQLIGGDFNTNDFYWLANVLPLPGGAAQRSAVRRAMEQHGFRTPLNGRTTTFPLFGQHLDWIFVKGLKPVASRVQPVPFSDHHALWMRFHVPS